MLLQISPSRLLSVYGLLVTTLLAITVVAVPLIAPAPDIERRDRTATRLRIVLAAKSMGQDNSRYVPINQQTALNAKLWFTLFLGPNRGYEVVHNSNPLKITQNIASPRLHSGRIDRTRLLQLRPNSEALEEILSDEDLRREIVWRTIGDAQNLIEAIKKMNPGSTVLEITDDLSHIAASFEYLTLVKNNYVNLVLKAEDLTQWKEILQKIRALRSEEKSS
ncbi:hypothetical protein F5051DRAFT_444677 [Lentinula edodes]|nr:hypothetical protein F5051DRAFT_444677 [Lentinula edodes]